MEGVKPDEREPMRRTQLPALVKTVPSILHIRQMAALRLDVRLSEDHGLNTLERRTGR